MFAKSLVGLSVQSRDPEFLIVSVRTTGHEQAMFLSGRLDGTGVYRTVVRIVEFDCIEVLEERKCGFDHLGIGLLGAGLGPEGVSETDDITGIC
jgi:hypothetical protein